MAFSIFLLLSILIMLWKRNRYLDSRSVDIELFEDGESFLVELIGNGDVGDVGGVIVIQTVDVLHDAAAVGFDGRQDEQVLQIAVVAEDGAVEDNLLEELDELVGQIGRHESFDGNRNVFGVLRLRQGRLDHLIDELAAELVALVEHFDPQLGIPALNQIARFRFEQRVVVADFDQFTVALAALVGHAGQMRIAFLAVFAHHAAVVEAILLEEALGVVVAVDVNLGQGIVGGWFHRSFVDARLEPGQQQLEAVSFLNLLDQLVGRELTADDHDQRFDDILRAVDVEQAADHHGQPRRVHLLHVNLNVLLKAVAVEVEHQVVHEIETVAHDDKRKLVS